MSDRWRLLLHGPVDGALNMAIDRAVQHAHAHGSAPPTLRLYGWSRPTVTLGRFQDVAGVDLGYCASHGIDVVRRYTGGRGVLHDDEVTYCVVAGVSDGMPRGVAASYAHLCTALVAAFDALGVAASVTRSDERPHSGGACYLQTTRADVALGTAKLAGSAQVWMQDTVMQHGSFVRTRDHGREAALFRLDVEQTRKLSATATLESALGSPPDTAAITGAVRAGFEEALGIDLQEGSLNLAEIAHLSELLGTSGMRSLKGGPELEVKVEADSQR